MPSHRTHRKIERLMLGEEYPEVDWYMDKPYKYLGPSHRKVRHDLSTVVLIGACCGPRAMVASMLHIAADFGMTAARRRAKAFAGVRGSTAKGQSQRLNQRKKQ